uniref:hypothetical protein n=1 Tax=uncultured Sphingomonas sp. TaxID=158754 RepID=UPI0035CA1FA6
MEEKPKTTFEDTARAFGEDVVEVIDSAVEQTSKLLGGEDGNRIVGGAVVGALAAIVLPFSLVTGALLGAGYAAYRKLNK